MTTPSDTVVEVLEDGSQVVEVTTTESKEEEYDIQIQGSDRKYPAIVLRRRHRGKGATIRTISKNGQHSDLYPDYEAAINGYFERRAKRLDNTHDNSSDNTPTERKKPTTLGDSKGSTNAAGEGWLDQALQSVVSRRDNSPKDTD